MTRYLICFLCIVSIPAFAQSENVPQDDRWVEVFHDDEGGFWVDSETLRFVGDNLFEAWVWSTWFVDKDEGGDWWRMMALSQFDCEQKRRAPISIHSEINGEFGSPTNVDDLRWRYVIPGTVDEAVLDFVCSTSE
jgi:hypothetical protein